MRKCVCNHGHWRHHNLNGEMCQCGGQCTRCTKCNCNAYTPKAGNLKIGLDFDGTYNAMPEVWDIFIEEALKRGHEVFIVTARADDPDWAPEVRAAIGNRIPIIFTNFQQKEPFTKALGIDIDVWVDDNPSWIPAK